MYIKYIHHWVSCKSIWGIPKGSPLGGHLHSFIVPCLLTKVLSWGLYYFKLYLGFYSFHMLHLPNHNFFLLVVESKVNEVTHLALLLIKRNWIIDSLDALPKFSLGKTCCETAFWNLVISSHPQIYYSCIFWSAKQIKNRLCWFKQKY